MTDPNAPVLARTHNVEDSRALAASLGPILAPGDVVALSGDLGAGKTAFVQGVARGLGSRDHVASPTFTLVRHYTGRLPIVHMDVYRLDRIQDVMDIGFEDLLDEGGVMLIEWGDMIEGILPLDHLTVRLRFADDGDLDLRTIELQGRGVTWETRARALREAVGPWSGPWEG
jgi:tRNA threonylcarbamoyladenosine biosynthesis protein TsaE